ncbi:hypothetical protein QGM61_02115 [Pseudohongiella sp. SYSU M77423]|uniref:hypothetical protein n=1 Tax=Pseudohongiella sp. SYSU M77423 TaxID=3042312 RepID=UPI002480FEC3|nr:hypothetical protein [Pseudohongiella sp. SYSU M77423]MDH7942604.1 hypothetical protein [Pseudohongiella sp. SYSU M77423]
MHQITPKKLTLAIAVCGLAAFTVLGAQAAEAKSKNQAEVTNASDSNNKARGHDHDGPGKGHPDHKGKGHGHNHGGSDHDDDGDNKGKGKDKDRGHDHDGPGKGHPDHKGKGHGHNHGSNDDDDSAGSGDDVAVVDGNCAIYRAGQHIVVGSVCVTLDGDNLLVDYILEDGWELSEPHLWVGTSLDDAPTTRKGSPSPGQFPYTASVMGVGTHTFTIPASDLGIDPESYCADPSALLVAAHGVVSKSGQTESAWAGETRFTEKGSWATYFGVNAECANDDDDDDNGSGLPENCGITDTRSVGLPLVFNGSGQSFVLTDSLDVGAAYGNGTISSAGVGAFGMILSPVTGFDIRRVDLYVGAQGSYTVDQPITYSIDTTAPFSGGLFWTGDVNTVIIPSIAVSGASDVAAFVTICAEGAGEQE